PIARLTHAQAAYHFISGYTAKLAGTEIGVKEPTATFSACFGAPFMPRHPGEYARMLMDRLERQGAQGWLLHTGLAGWSVRDRRADEHQSHAGDGPRCPRRPAVRRPDEDRSGLRLRGADELPRRPDRVPRSAGDLGGQGRLRPAGDEARVDVRGELHGV